MSDDKHWWQVRIEELEREVDRLLADLEAARSEVEN